MNLWPLLCGLLFLWGVLSMIYILRLRKKTAPGLEPGPANVPVDPRVNLEKALMDWQVTFDAIVDPVLVLDREMNIVRANRSAVKLLDEEGRSIEGVPCYTLFAGGDQPCKFCPIPVVEHERKTYSLESSNRYLGKIFTITCAPIMVEGEIAGYIHTVKDLTHQRKLEKQVVQAHKMDAVATLAGGIAHDFNNILGAILGNADLLLYRLPTREVTPNGFEPSAITYEEIGEHLQSIKRAGNRAKELVAQILAFSRQQISKRKPVDITPIIKESCKLLRSSLPATIELKVSIAGRIGKVHADPGQIQQVLMNLTSNAAQAIEDRIGTIDISLRDIETGVAERKRYPELAEGKYVVLTVRDTGKGIPDEVLQRIFDPFFTTRDVGDGSGMGLAVIHGIILAHDGVIDVKSKEGKGTQFTVFFPRIDEELYSEDEQVISMPKGSETILFVDDEEEIVTMRTRMLEYLGYTVLPATSPEKALAYLSERKGRVDLMITDQTMPRMTGIGLAKKALEYEPDLPVILCSGYSDAVTPEEAREAGVRRFLAKPLDMHLLAVAIREILPNNTGVQHENTNH